MAMLPDDSTLTVAIKDATVSTSTVNPARITSAVQKMRPDWCVNKRRVKRLLRSMNNDAWKAAVNTTVNAGNPSSRGSATTTAAAAASEPPSAEAPAAPAAGAAETATTRSSIRAAAKAAKAAKAAEKALKLADKAAAKAADKAAGGVVAPGGGEEPLSESLDLATDLELEPGIDLKADLGIVTNAPAAAAPAAATAVTEVEDSGRAEPADNLGFEMIEKAEVVESGAGTGANGKTRKPWPWAWTRSS
ncbi:unnamed protein product [Ectocarpus fasciculatus]